MDYREALMKMPENHLKVIYEQLFDDSADEQHQIQLVESIRKEVLSKAYIEQILIHMPEDEYNFYMKAIEAEHTYIPMMKERMPFAVQFLLMFESPRGLLIPHDLIKEVKALNPARLKEARKQLDKEQTFIAGVMFLYGYVHVQLVKELYQQYFNETLSDEMIESWKQAIGLHQVDDMIMLPVVYEGYDGSSVQQYNPHRYYRPASLEELKLYTGREHHRHGQEMQELLAFIDTHTEDETAEEKEVLFDTVTFLIIASGDANITMQELINLFAHRLSEQEFKMFESLFIKVLEHTRLWVYGGMTETEMNQTRKEQQERQTEEKEKKVIDLDVFRHE